MDIVKYTEFLVSSLVDDPEMVKVEMFDEDENTKIIEVMVPENQMKYVIHMRNFQLKQICFYPK